MFESHPGCRPSSKPQVQLSFTSSYFIATWLTFMHSQQVLDVILSHSHTLVISLLHMHLRQLKHVSDVTRKWLWQVHVYTLQDREHWLRHRRMWDMLCYVAVYTTRTFVCGMNFLQQQECHTWLCIITQHVICGLPLHLQLQCTCTYCTCSVALLSSHSVPW